MKKKFFAIYALIGALVASPIFTSCVDDEESPSVTAIRDAKTAELKSIAALKKAEAQAQATLDAANIALKAAQADAQLAAAKKAEAEAALQETQNEADAVALLVQKKEAEMKLDSIQGAIEKQEILIQKALLEAQADLLDAKEQLDRATQGYDANQKAELQSLALAYSTAVTELIQAKKDLMAMEAQLATYETGLVDAKDGLEQTIARYNNNILDNELSIAQYKKYANYTEDLDALKKEQIEAVAACNLAMDKYYAADNAQNDVADNVDSDKLDELEQAILDDEFYQFTLHNLYDAENEQYTHISNVNYDAWRTITMDEYYNQVLFGSLNYDAVEYEYQDYKGTAGETIEFEYEYTVDVRQTELRASQYIEDLQANIKGAQTTITADKTALTAAETALTAAKKAWDEAAEADKTAKYYEYEAAVNEVVRLQNKIKRNENSIEYWNKQLASWTKALGFLQNAETFEAALQAKIKAYNDAVIAEWTPVVEAWKVTIDAYIVYEEADAALEAINALINGSGYAYGAQILADWIKSCESNIEYYQEQIEKAKKLMYDADFTWEEMIAWQKAQIEAQKTIVAAKEIALADAKAALDAAMPAEEEEGTEEETPAE